MLSFLRSSQTRQIVGNPKVYRRFIVFSNVVISRPRNSNLKETREKILALTIFSTNSIKKTLHYKWKAVIDKWHTQNLNTLVMTMPVGWIFLMTLYLPHSHPNHVSDAWCTMCGLVVDTSIICDLQPWFSSKLLLTDHILQQL